jgi:ABC-type multidrug transport system fused ATPase/permease subunit
MGIIPPYMLKNLVDKAVVLDVPGFVRFLCYAAVFLALGFIAMYFGKYSDGRLAALFSRDFKNHIARHIQQLPVSFIDRYRTGDLVSRLEEDMGRTTQLVNDMPGYLCQPLLMIGAIIYMSLLNWKLMLASIIFVPVSSFLFDKINKPIQTHSRQLMEEKSKANSMLQDFIAGIYIVKAFNLQNVLREKFGKTIRCIETKGMKIEKLNALLIPVFLFLRLTPQLVVPLYGGYLAFKGEISVGTLLSFGLLIGFVFGPAESMLRLAGQVRETKPAFERIMEIAGHAVEIGKGEAPDAEKGSPVLNFSNVSFKYDKEKYVLKNVSFEIPRGKVTALAGPSGSGKSTIIRLICGFYDNYEGNIEVFGKDMRSCDILKLRENISLMPQEAFLFPASVYENISYGKPGTAYEEVMGAARAADLDEFVKGLPDGYKTVISERGGNLSGGQCQRIALARGILKGAPLFLLDEPASALDAHSERIIREAVFRFAENRTILVVAHRLSTIRNADHIIVLDNGTIAEQGRHEDLISRDTLYRKLYISQADENICQSGGYVSQAGEHACQTDKYDCRTDKYTSRADGYPGNAGADPAKEV